MTTASSIPQDVRVGIIGVGRMGADHVARITGRIKGARVAALTDFSPQTARAVAADVPGCRVCDGPEELIAAPDVDAVIIASPGDVHRAQVLSCIEAGTPVLCEKPLAHTPEDALAVVRAEAEHIRGGGMPLVSVGFMRRFDAEYMELKDAMDSGELGEIMLLNCKHRNESTLPGYSDHSLIHDSAVHEIDAISFFLEEDVVEVQTIATRPGPNAPDGLHDPMLCVFRTASGRVVTDELYVSTGSGYEVRTEVLGSRGVATIGLGVGRVTTQLDGGRWGGSVPLDFRPRFAAAYDVEVQEWIHAIEDGRGVAARSATAWDGYVAAAVCEATVGSLDHAGPVPVQLETRP
jgi:myo-inositol 2-dehydrogenase/D-chiro-inositol 1-dehydrogenase